MQDASAEEIDVGAAIHCPLQRFSILRRPICPSTGLVVHGSSSAADRGEVATEPRRKPREQGALCCGEDLTGISGHLAPENLVQAERLGDSGAERWLVFEEPGSEQVVLGIQRRWVRHQQPGQPIATRNRPDGRKRSRSETVVPGGTATLADPVPHSARSSAEPERDQITPKLGRVAASLVPSSRQHIDERVEHAAAWRLLPRWWMAEPEPPSHRIALGAEFGGDACDGRSGSP